jgi:hypothetical protein
MSTSKGALSRLKKLSTEKMSLEVNSWDSAIQKAKLRIEELRLAIREFQARKKSGEPFGAQSS